MLWLPICRAHFCKHWTPNQDISPNNWSWFCPSKPVSVALAPLLTWVSQVLLSLFSLEKTASEREGTPKGLWNNTGYLHTHSNPFHRWGHASIRAEGAILHLVDFIQQLFPSIAFVFIFKSWLRPALSSFSKDEEGFSNQFPRLSRI